MHERRSYSMIAEVVSSRMIDTNKEPRLRLVPDSGSGMSKQPAANTGALLDMCNHQQRRY